MKVLVVGADRVDAGKTTFSVGLVERIDGDGYKPRAGNDYWFDHDDVRTAVAEDRLYGKDARRLAAASASDLDPEDLNPVHRLWRPAPGHGNGLVGPADRAFLVDRVAGSFVVNATAELPGLVGEQLPIEGAVAVESVAELNAETERRHVPALRAVAERIRRSDRAVVESYGDIARPLQGTLPDDADPESLYDAVAVVEPCRVRVFRGDRWVRACSVASASPRDGSLERQVPDVTHHLDPIDTLELTPLSKDQRKTPPAIAEEYAPAYDALLDAADG